MPEMKKSTQITNVLLFNIPMALAVSAMCQGIAIAQGSVPHWIWPMYWINVIIAWVIADIIGICVQPPKRSFAAAAKAGQPGSKEFGKRMGILVNTWYTTILVVCMTILNTQILAHAPFIGTIMGILINYIPVWVLCMIISALCMQPIENLARKLCNDPAQR